MNTATTLRLSMLLSCALMLTAIIALPCHAAEEASAISYGQGEDVYLTRSTITRAGDVLYIPWPARPGKVERYVIAMDIANPAQPRELGRVAIDGFPQDVAVKENRAYVVNGLSLITLDISDAAAMKIVHTLPLTDNPMQGPQAIDLAEGDLAILACRRGGIRAIDLKEPSNPKPVAQVALPGFIRDVKATPDGYVFIAADTMGLLTAKLERDDAKGLVFKLPFVYPKPKGPPTFDGTVASLTTHDQHVYFAGGSEVMGMASTEPLKDENPYLDRFPWQMLTADRGDAQVNYGSYAHDLAVISRDPTDDAAGKSTTIAIIADGEAGITMLDITDPSSPRLITQPDTTRQASNQTMLATAIHILQLENQSPVVYVLDQNHGLRVFTLDKDMNLQPAGDGVKFDKD